MNTFARPKLTNQFLVTYDSTVAKLKHKIPIEELAAQTVSFDIGTEYCNMPSLQYRTKNVIAWVEDTQSCNVMKILRALQQNRVDDIIITVSLMSGDNSALERFTYVNCSLVGIQHSLMTYQLHSNSSFSGNINTYTSTVPSRQVPAANVLGRIEIPTASVTMQKLVQFSFTDFSHEILV